MGKISLAAGAVRERLALPADVTVSQPLYTLGIRAERERERGRMRPRESEEKRGK